jgi:hypothetical protein
MSACGWLFPTFVKVGIAVLKSPEPIDFGMLGPHRSLSASSGRFAPHESLSASSGRFAPHESLAASSGAFFKPHEFRIGGRYVLCAFGGELLVKYRGSLAV